MSMCSGWQLYAQWHWTCTINRLCGVWSIWYGHSDLSATPHCATMSAASGSRLNWPQTVAWQFLEKVSWSWQQSPTKQLFVLGSSITVLHADHMAGSGECTEHVPWVTRPIVSRSVCWWMGKKGDSLSLSSYIAALLSPWWRTFWWRVLTSLPV